jgi:membrane protein implicated in regulation of membrane protease activity
MKVKTVEYLMGNILQLFKAQTKLFLLEFALMRYSLIPFLLLTLFFTIAAGGVWALILSLTAYITYHLTHSIIISLLVTMVLGLIIAVALLFSLRNYFKQMKFTKTRQSLKRFTKNKANHEPHIPTQTTN